MKRLLLLSASSGRGHVAAARAILSALGEEHPEVEVRHEDLFDHVALPFRLLGREGYDACVNWTPGLWRIVYRGSDGADPVAFSRAVTRAGARRFLALVRRWQPDRILSTYWAPGAMLPWIREAEGRDVPLATVITDADLHAAWWQPATDRYYVSDDSIRERLAARGYPRDRVVVSGIPAHPRFRPVDRGEARRVLGLDERRPWVLLVAGPRAMRSLASNVGAILRARPEVGVVVLAGRDGALRARLGRETAFDGRLVAGGMVPDLERWLAAADLLVAKGGGLITSEATAVGTPILIHRPIPGQEEANARRLESEGAALVVRDLSHLVETVAGLLGDGARLRAMADFARRVGRPDAARTVATEEARRLLEG